MIVKVLVIAINNLGVLKTVTIILWKSDMPAYCEAKLRKRALASFAEQSGAERSRAAHFAKTRNISILWLCFYYFQFHFFNFSNTRDRERKGAT